ncbi:MAG: S24/S26 family peptidase [Oscillospiraceae bacterium]|nr:S24/S26 family peptidase [Oscillospiraceae bacterium]
MSSFEEELERSGVLVFTNKGKSMLPLLRQNRDLMVIEKKGPERCKKYDAVLFKRGDKYVMHRILKVRERDYYIVGDNCRKGEYVRDEQILGVLKQVVRDGKTVDTGDPAYQRYVHLWCDLFPLRAGLFFIRDGVRFTGRKLKKLLR